MDEWFGMRFVEMLHSTLTASGQANAEQIRTLVASAGEHRGEPYGASFLIETPLGEFKITVESA